MCLYRPVFPAALMGLILGSLMWNLTAHSRQLAFGPPFFWAERRHACAMMPFRFVPRGGRSGWVGVATAAFGGSQGCVGETSPAGACVGGAGTAGCWRFALEGAVGGPVVSQGAGAVFRLSSSSRVSVVECPVATPSLSRTSGTGDGLSCSRAGGTRTVATGGVGRRFPSEPVPPSPASESVSSR